MGTLRVATCIDADSAPLLLAIFADAAATVCSAPQAAASAAAAAASGGAVVEGGEEEEDDVSSLPAVLVADGRAALPPALLACLEDADAGAHLGAYADAFCSDPLDAAVVAATGLTAALYCRHWLLALRIAACLAGREAVAVGEYCATPRGGRGGGGGAAAAGGAGAAAAPAGGADLFRWVHYCMNITASAEAGGAAVDAGVVPLAACVVERVAYALPHRLASDVAALPRGTQVAVERHVAAHVTPVLFDAQVARLGAGVGGRAPGWRDFSAAVRGVGQVGGIVALDAALHPNGAGAEFTSGAFEVRLVRAAGEVVATYRREDIEATLAVRITLPPTFPLRAPSISCDTRQGVTAERWRRWELAMMNLLTARDGTVLDALALWKADVDREFEGVEPCPICYAVVHMTSRRMPRTACATCKNKFHSDCLHKWFSSSHDATCPMCRSRFPGFGY